MNLKITYQTKNIMQNMYLITCNYQDIWQFNFLVIWFVWGAFGRNLKTVNHRDIVVRSSLKMFFL